MSLIYQVVATSEGFVEVPPGNPLYDVSLRSYVTCVRKVNTSNWLVSFYLVGYLFYDPVTGAWSSNFSQFATWPLARAEWNTQMNKMISEFYI